MTSVDPCSHCGFDLDDGDIYMKLRDMNEYKNISDNEIEVIALYYGWTPQHKKRFTKKVVLRLSGGHQYSMCPQCRLIFQ